MSGLTEVYVVSDSADWVDGISAVMDGISGIFGSGEEFGAAGVASGGGLLLIGPGIPEAEADSLVETLVGTEEPWSVFRGRDPGEAGEIDLVPVPLPSPCAIALGDLASRLRRGEEEAPPLELCQILAFVARARHDINNPLTSALAETQLLLMDVEEPETRTGLETIEAQLRRIRDLVARLQALPRPRSRDRDHGARRGGGGRGAGA